MLISFLFVEVILTTNLTKVNFRRVRKFIASTAMALQEKFQAAVKVIQSLPKDGPYQPANNMKLRFYSLYKQSTDGPCNIPRPAFYDIIGRAKWDAWSKLGDLPNDDAMNQYIDELKNIVETMSFNGDVQNFLEAVGPFYEFVNLHGEEMGHIKETIERVTSSASTSPSTTVSTESSTQSSPIHDIAKRQEEVVKNGPVGNGYIPNHKLPDESVSSMFVPPSAPIHRRSIPHCSKDIPLHDLENGDTSDEILEVDDETKFISQTDDASRPASNENIHSGTDSERYYSGDSDPDFEEKFARLQAHSLDSATKTQNPFSPERTLLPNRYPSSELVLQTTVERLNRDVDHILARLRILEAAYATNGQLANGGLQTARRRRGLFSELSRGSLTLIISWPFLAYFIIKLISWWISRRRRRGNPMLRLSN